VAPLKISVREGLRFFSFLFGKEMANKNVIFLI
jgi:hypothetical protein